jgi:biopolymer transport protein TolR
MPAHIAAEDEPMADMNLIPLIDIALTLLIIMMVTTVFIKHPGVSLKLPETATREGAPETKKDLTIVVAATGDMYVDAVKQTPEQLQARLRDEAARTNKQARVLVKGDRDTTYSRIMDVMDMVRQAGLTRVVLPTDPKTPGYANPPAPSTTAPTSAGMPGSAGAAFSNALGQGGPPSSGPASSASTGAGPASANQTSSGASSGGATSAGASSAGVSSAGRQPGNSSR